MKKKTLYALWGGMFILCAGLGFIPDPAGALKVLMGGLAAACFIPPALLLYGAAKARDRETIRLVGALSALSLLLTGLCLVLNFLTALGSEVLGQMLHYILVVVSSPMFCAGNWAMSLFAWACLLMVSLRLRH